jgi:hypothetical protein
MPLAASAARNLFLRRARVLCADLIGADPLLLDQATSRNDSVRSQRAGGATEPSPIGTLAPTPTPTPPPRPPPPNPPMPKPTDGPLR